MIIKEKRYIKKCDCGTEIIYTRRDCYHNTTWDIYSLYCPSCSHEYSYRRGTHHDLFDKEYEEDSVDKDEEIERLNSIINNDFSKICREKMIDKLSANEMILLQDKEIERLNNIIKRFEEDLREVYLTFGEFSEEYTENCIKKLKGENNE